jgi:hypothetical protein
MKRLALFAAIAAIASCGGMSEPDDPEMPSYYPSIQQSLLEDLRIDLPRGDDIEYAAWSVEDRKALGPWTKSLGEAESIRREWEGKLPSLNFTVLWRQNPAPTGGMLRVKTDNVHQWEPTAPQRSK